MVGLLRQGEPAGRALLEELCGPPLGRLVDRLVPRDQPARDRDRALLVHRTLRWMEMYLRSRDAGEFTHMGRETFLAQLLAAAYKVLAPVGSGGQSQRPPHAPRGAQANEAFHSLRFRVRTYRLPLDAVGGDWAGVRVEGDGSLWILVADVTGHGSPAHIIANGLPYLWETRAIAQCRSAGRAPGEVLAALGAALQAVLPEGVFVEATLVRFTPAGRAWVSGAGNCRLIVRQSGRPRFDLHRVGGSWLGLGLARHDERAWKLARGDEFLLASDGLYEQRDSQGRPLELTLDARAAVHLAPGRSVHDAVLATLNETLAVARQNDDILVVTVRFGIEEQEQAPEPSPPDPGTEHAGM
jgi:hypothetical protein